MARWTMDDVKHLIKKPTPEKKKSRSKAEVFTPASERLLCGDDLERQTQSAIIDFLSALNLLFYHVNNAASSTALPKDAPDLMLSNRHKPLRPSNPKDTRRLPSASASSVGAHDDRLGLPVAIA